MAREPRARVGLRRAVAWAGGWIFAAAFYLLLIDITELPELIVGAVAAALAATGFELAREQRVAGEAIRLRWLLRAYRPLLRVAPDIAALCTAAIAQIVRRQPRRGEFRTVAFSAQGDGALAAGRRALAQWLGSFAPNTIIVGVDPERDLILAHQLRRRGGWEAIDVLGLGGHGDGVQEGERR